MSSQKTIYEKLGALIEEMGVETYVIIFKDPDSDSVMSKQNGSTIWRLGALETQKELALREWVE